MGIHSTYTLLRLSEPDPEISCDYKKCTRGQRFLAVKGLEHELH